MRRTLPIAAAALAMLTAACSSIPLKQRQEATLERYEKYAGAPIDHITYLGRYDGWTPLSPDQLVVWTTPWEAYLIKVGAPCADLTFQNGISLTTNGGFNTVATRFDYVKTGHWQCQIEQIRPVDYRRMQADLRAQGAQAKDAGQAAAPK